MDIHLKSVSYWIFSQIQENCQPKFEQIAEQARKSLPANFYQHPYLHLDWMKQQKLYKYLQTMPKGVIHHDHFDCNQDAQFYDKCIVDDPLVYINQQKQQFFVGTKTQAEQKNFIPIKQYENILGSRQKLVKKISNFTMMSKQDYSNGKGLQWDIFQKKIVNFFPLLYSLHIFKKYVNHILRKFIKNGYQRLQFRCLLINLTQYNQNGEIIKVHEKKKFAQAFDEVYNEIIKQYPSFTVGFIFFGLLSFTPQQNKETLRDVCELGWSKTVGIDFVNEQDPYGSLQPYDKLANQILQKYPKLQIKKVYHCGETKNHKNRNIQIALNAGTARVGHGNNVVHWPQTLQRCIGKVCFQKCLVSNLIFKYSYDARFDAAGIIFNIGVPITLNPDDPGKFGYQDTTCDYFMAAVSFNWNLKCFKVIGIHSIDHSVDKKENKVKMVKQYHQKWVQWSKQFAQ